MDLIEGNILSDVLNNVLNYRLLDDIEELSIYDFDYNQGENEQEEQDIDVLYNMIINSRSK